MSKTAACVGVKMKSTSLSSFCEPTTPFLLALGLVGLGLRRRFKK